MLEKTLFEKIRTGKKVNLEKAILISYGYNKEKQIAEYRTKIDKLNKSFRKFSSKDLKVRRKTARALYKFLWKESNMEVFEAMHVFRLENSRKTRNLQEDEETGECVRRTTLYSLIGVKQNLNMTILYNGGHVLSRLRIGKRFLDIENTCEEGLDGFDIFTKGSHYFSYGGLKEGSLIDLIGLIYKNRGFIEFEKGQWAKAITHYDKAIQIFPHYASTYVCRGEAKEKIGRIQRAIKDYDKAIEIDSQNITAYENRGKAKLKIKDEEGAEEDLKISSHLLGALMNRRRYYSY